MDQYTRPPYEEWLDKFRNKQYNDLTFDQCLKLIAYLEGQSSVLIDTVVEQEKRIESLYKALDKLGGIHRELHELL